MRLSLLLSPASRLLALTALAVNAFAAANPPLTDIVDDQTAFAVVVLDAPALLRGWDASSFARTWNDDQVVKFFSPMRAGMKMDTWDDQTKAATGKTLRELLALAKGQALVALPAAYFTAAVAEPGLGMMLTPPVLIAVELGDNAATVEKLANEAAAKTEGLRVETTNYAGFLVHTNTPPAPKAGGRTGAPTVTAMCQGIWLISPNYDRVCAAIDAIKKGGLSNSLGRSESFLRAQKRAGPSHLIALGNFSAIYPALLSALGAQNKGSPLVGAPFTAEELLKGLGLDAFREIFVALNFGEKETLISMGLGWAEERGLAKVLAYDTKGAAPRPDWVPAKWNSVTTARFDLRAAYAAIEEMVRDVSSELFTDLQSTLADGNKALGIDLRRDFIGSLGSELVMANALPAGADPEKPFALNRLDQLIAISLENPENFTKSVEAFKRTMLGESADQFFTKRVYLGQTLYTFSPPNAASNAAPGSAPGSSAESPGFTYAIANRTLLIGVGSSATVEAAVQGMTEKHDSFWAKPEVKAVLATMPENASSLQVQDNRVIMAGFFEMLATLPLAVVDSSAKPDAARLARYWGLSSGWVTKDAKGLFSVTRLANPQP